MNIYIFPNLDKLNCKEYTAQACEILHEENAVLYMSNGYENDFSFIGYVNFTAEAECIKICDLIIVIGGDGTILKCANGAADYHKPILGINCGRLGFMASLEHSELEMLRALSRNEYNLSRRMMIKAEIIHPNKPLEVYHALNDIAISKSSECKIADFEVSKGDKRISYLRADGVIFSTATGSTAYSMSAGGSIIEPEMECIEFTQICPHSLFARSMIFSPDSVIDVKTHCSNSEIIVNVDGNVVSRISNNTVIRISRSPLYINIIDISGGSFFSSVNMKLMQPIKEISEGI